MMHYLQNLNDRERLTLGVGGACLLVWLFYLLMYSPLETQISNKTRMLQEKKATLQWIEQVRAQNQNRPGEKTIAGSKLLSVIATELSQPPLQNFPHQLQQTGQGDIQLSFESLPYTQFLTWIWTLTHQYHITMKQLSIERTDKAGLVKVSLVFSS